MQSGALISTKLHPPVISRDMLPRRQLVERLKNGRFRKMTLISAPAGYGKSSLACLWGEACDWPVAWVSLDKNDSELDLFLSYVVTAIQGIFPQACKNTLSLLNGLQRPPSDILATSLVRETAALTQPFLLILDDYHLIQNQAVHQLIDTLIRYKSATMHLVLITRQDPPLDLITLRAKNQVTEIRLADLRFTASEVEQYLQSHLPGDTPPELMQQLVQRSEGWAVGLRLATLALRNQPVQARLLNTYPGSNQYIMSYLVGEVLARQPQQVQTFLLYTSLLDRFCAPLCDALLDDAAPIDAGSQAVLDRLHRENLFIIPLDTHKEWFRYHHLFQEILQHQLSATLSATAINRLHVRAGAWFARHGYIEEALDHAFAANDIAYAIQIVAKARCRLMNATQWQRLEQLILRFPRDVIDRSADLYLAETWLCYHHTQYNKLAVMLAHLNRLIQEPTVTASEKEHFLGEISALHSLLSYFAVDPNSACTLAQQALTRTAPDLSIVRVFARLLLAVSYQMSGDVSKAYATILHNFDEESEQSDIFKATTLVTWCNVAWFAADLNSIQQHAAQAVVLCQEASSPEIQGNAHYHLGTVAYLQNNLAVAAEQFSLVQQRPYATYGDTFAHSSCGLALTYQAQGREQEAQEVVEAAIAYFLVTGNTQLLMLMRAFQAELACQQGKLSTALQWAAQFDSRPSLAPMYCLYALHFTPVKIWLAENTVESRKKAAELLAQIKTFLETTHNHIFLIDALILQALIDHTHGDNVQALANLDEALNLALPGNIIRPFINLGSMLRHLLHKTPVQDPELASFKARILDQMAQPTSQSGQGSNGAQPLLEPLTDRELDVLTLISQRQTDKEIARKLHISPHTVRSHLKNIFSKLDVNNRRQAARRAQSLGLVTSE